MRRPQLCLWALLAAHAAEYGQEDAVLKLDIMDSGQPLTLRFAPGENYFDRALEFVNAYGFQGGEGCASPACVADMLAELMAVVAKCDDGSGGRRECTPQKIDIVEERYLRQSPAAVAAAARDADDAASWRRARAIELEADAALRGQGKAVHAVAKRVDNHSRVPEHDTFANEKKWLERLSHTGLVAAPLAYDDATRTVVTEYAGHPIDASNVPHDVVAQLGRILDMLEEHNCRHNDFIPRNLLVLDGVVRVIDFNWAWEIDRSVPAAWHEQIPDLGKPSQGLRCAALYDDRCTAENVLDRIAPTAQARRLPDTAETHIVADWTNRFANSFIETACRRAGLEVVHAVAMPIMPEATRRATMSRFYSGADLSPSDQRGATPFTLHILRDPNPAYEVRATTKGRRRVNAKVFDLKQQLRAPTTAGGAPLRLHATDNIQETKDNLETLGLSELYYPKKRFDRVAAALRALDAVPGLRYVVLRHADTVLESSCIFLSNSSCGNSDVDLLVSDYFKAKTALDGTSTDPPGERYDDGGRGVRNLVSVAGRQVSFDLRTVDHDDRWITMTRRFRGSLSEEAFLRRYAREGPWSEPCA